MKAEPSSTAFTIERCAEKDAPALAALSARLFEQAYGDTHPQPDLGIYLAREFDAVRIAKDLRSPAVTAFLAHEEQGEAIGYALLRESLPPPASRVSASRAVEIVRFYMEQAWHGRGVARAMMNECLNEAARRGAEIIWLAVWQQAPRPQAFYAKCGFEVVGTTTFRFGERLDDDFVLARSVRRRPDG